MAEAKEIWYQMAGTSAQMMSVEAKDSKLMWKR
jgi:hypothetical protein